MDGPLIAYLPNATRHALWPDIKDLLARGARLSGAKAYSRGECVWLAVVDGVVVAALTTALTDDGVAEVRNCGGYRVDEWLGEADRVLTAWARDCGAEYMTLRGRKGWLRKGAPLGWNPAGMSEGFPVLEKELK